MSKPKYVLLWRIFLVLFWLTLTSPSANALDPDRQISQYGHTVWRVQDGEIPLTTQIAQTSDGYIWLGTSQGLMRFDGVRFMRWQPPQGQNLPGSQFSALLGSRDGSLWIGTTRGLARWKDGQLRTYTDLEHPAGIAEIIEDDSGTIWATRYGTNAREAPLCSITEDRLRCFGKKDGIPVGYGLGLARDNGGNIWFGSTVLVKWRPGTPATTYFGEIADKLARGDGVIDVVLGPSGTAWATLDATGQQLGVQYYSAGKWTSYVVPGFDGARVRSAALLVDRQESLWVGTQDDGIYRISGGVADHFTTSDGLSGNTAANFFEDREGNVWVVTESGLDLFRDTPIITYTTRQGLSDAGLRSVLALRDGSVWVATNEALNIIRKEKGVTAISGRELLHRHVYSMVEDHTGRIWVGADNELLVFQSEHFREMPRRDGRHLAGVGHIEAMEEDTSGRIWVFVSTGQLFSLVGNTIEEHETGYQNVSTSKYLAADLSGGIWLGDSGKCDVSYYRDGHLQTTSLGIPNCPVRINALFVDDDNSLLVSAAQGLYRLSDGKLSFLGRDNGLPCPAVFSLIRDNHRNLWIYTQCGLLKIEEAEWAKWIEKPHDWLSFTTLDALDGAQAGTGQPDQPRSSKAPDGRLWFVTGVSAQVIDPDRLYDTAPPPPVYVEAVVADHKVLKAGSSMQIPALTRDLEVDYTAPSFSAPQKVRFRYMLEGHDREWQDAGTRRQAFYTDLAPRRYHFRVIACNSHGVWNQTGASLDFVVLPAYYQTWWFRSFCVIGLLGLLFASYQFRIHEMHQQFNASLEGRVAERTRIARDLHDTLLQSFQSVLLKLHAVTYIIPDRPDEAQRTLESVIDQATHAITEGRDAVQGLRSSTIVTNDLAAAIRIFCADLADQLDSNSPEFRVDVEGTPRDLAPIIRDEVYRIACEAVRNAFQHARAKRIEVEIRYDQRQLGLRIRDDGRGVDPKVLESGARVGHYGFPGLQERAKLVGGKLNVRSEPSSGTVIELVVPAAVVYAPSGRSHLLFRGKSAS